MRLPCRYKTLAICYNSRHGRKWAQQYDMGPGPGCTRKHALPNPNTSPQLTTPVGLTALFTTPAGLTALRVGFATATLAAAPKYSSVHHCVLFADCGGWGLDLLISAVELRAPAHQQKGVSRAGRASGWLRASCTNRQPQGLSRKDVPEEEDVRLWAVHSIMSPSS